MPARTSASEASTLVTVQRVLPPSQPESRGLRRPESRTTDCVWVSRSPAVTSVSWLSGCARAATATNVTSMSQLPSTPGGTIVLTTTSAD
jgi:hypothetical protein